ncbi:serine/threonine-protein kinase [Paraglaciecola sp. MB-3u-78]|uniref:serine/threonine-protein kinase n=1 Tax=Paraglaciecola sp. MB-3u-78 TaxID=2058332 RepID=UPI000C33874E|nr:serine/threonine-protein kinase [Paraglaciecola sp. MB-3u-78]PKG97038.1 hypothetical protein CXF95_22290 [Paraglaciecola sp. MB-3u-78]
MNPKMSREKWQKIQVILDEIFHLSENENRIYLQNIEKQDPHLHADIEQFLAAQRNAPSYLDQSATELARHLVSNSPRGEKNALGEKIGAYILREEIARGGMGIVYRGERHGGEFEQQVAIKLLSSVSQSKENKSILLDRFRQEQQTLSSLNHPNIAQLFDGGFTESGVPYIVMEFVEGVDISQYCRLNNLQLEARLRLIIQVANVLAFAHKNLIIHRDIKPSNILINNSGQVKLLDFGIAKLIADDHLTDMTQTGESLLTPGFAAPEQIRKAPITVATDIYQLALVMYELITGHKGFSDQSDSLYELARVMCEKLPTAPSVICTREPNSSIAQHWQRKLRGDLDAITLKALRTESEHRYSSMLEFAKDIEAHLSGHLVEARQKNMRYLASSFSRRHWKFMLVASSFIVILLAYATTVTLQSQKIKAALAQSELEANKAQQVSKFMIDIFKTSDPNISGLQEISAQQLLDKGQQDIQQNLQQAPEIRAHMLSVLGDIYYTRGVYEQSDKLLTLALAQQKALPDHSPLQIAKNLTKLAISYSTQNKYQQAELLLSESLTIHRQKLTPLDKLDRGSLSEDQHVAYAETLNAYADLLKIRGEFKKAAQNFSNAIAIIKPFGDKQNELAIAYNGLAGVQHVQGQFDDAIKNMREGLRILALVQGEEHTYYTIALNNLVTILTDLEYFEEATVLSRKSLQTQMNMLGEDHPNVGNTLRSLGILSHRQGDFLSARDYLQMALSNKRQNLSEDNVTIGVILLFLGAVEQDLGQFEQASAYYQTMLQIFRKYQVADRILGRGLCQPASLLLATGEWRAANQQYAQALGLLPEQGVRTAIAQLGFARSALHLGFELARAESLSRAALEVRLQKYPENHSLVAEAQAVLGLVLHKQNQPLHALPLLRAAAEVLNKHPMYARAQSQDNLVVNVKKALAQLIL